MKIETLEIGADKPCAFVAEIGNAHNGKFETALKLITAAKDAGASAVKFQCYSPQELVDLRGDGPAPSQWGAQGWMMRNLYEKARTPFEWFHDLYGYARDIEIVPFSSCFGAESLEVLESVNNSVYKLAALDFGNYALREMVELTGKPVIRSCSFEIAPQYHGLQLLCPSGYPQQGFRLRNMLNGYQGFSYHGVDPGVGEMAAALGAQVVECHFMLDSEPSELEANISLTGTQFGRMVAKARQKEAA